MDDLSVALTPAGPVGQALGRRADPDDRRGGGGRFTDLAGEPRIDRDCAIGTNGPPHDAVPAGPTAG